MIRLEDMIHGSVEDQGDIAPGLLDITTALLKRIAADVPIKDDASDDCPGWRDVTELRATPGQLSLLWVLVEHERCTMQELAEHLAVAPSTATAMVKRLVAQGYIERSHDEADWRTVWVKATESGRKAVDIFRRVRLASLQRRLERLTDEERARIAAALPALHHLIEI
jgi:MarR family transcriptional regulator, organic hydroperoxide resistance regulator